MMLFLPELTLLGAGLVLFFLSLGQPSNGRVKTVAITLAAVTFFASLLCLRSEGFLFYSAYKVDLFSQLFKVLIAFGTLALLIFGAKDSGIKQKTQPEYYLFLFMSVLGLMMLVSSVEMMAIFVSLELSSFAVYIMVPMRKTSEEKGNQVEAGIKYLLFGVMATGLMLFGMSYIYGLTGTTQLPLIAERLADMYTQPAAIVAVMLVLAGFFYKLALFPLHFWVPDVYEGASNETTAFIATLPKIAAVAVLIRIVNLISGEGQAIVNVLMFCALASMFYGNLSALVQKDIKRLLGYSSISHAGFILVGLLTFTPLGYATAIYYITGYLLMNLACFLVICTVSEDGKNVAIEDLAGLYKRAPILSLTLIVGLFGLAGIPPFVGFTGKLMLLLGAFNQGHYLLVILAAFNTAIAIYYYLSIIRITFCTDPEERQAVAIGGATKIISIFLMIAIVVMGVFPSTFISMASKAVTLLM